MTSAALHCLHLMHCVVSHLADARAAGTVNATAVQQYTCNGTGAPSSVSRSLRQVLGATVVAAMGRPVISLMAEEGIRALATGLPAVLAAPRIVAAQEGRERGKEWFRESGFCLVVRKSRSRGGQRPCHKPRPLCYDANCAKGTHWVDLRAGATEGG